MGIITVDKLDHLYWLGRYTERVYTTLRQFFHVFDDMIDSPEGIYEEYCRRLNIPNIYTSNEDFTMRYLFDKENPDSLHSNMLRAFDNAVVLRDELRSIVLAYIQMSLNVFEAKEHSEAPRLELQEVLDYILAFWGSADDYVDSEDCRNIMKCGKYVERIDLYIRLEYHTRHIEKEFQKLKNRIHKTHMYCDIEKLNRLEESICKKKDWKENYQQILIDLGNIIEVK